jgi:hypothetical protein
VPPVIEIEELKRVDERSLAGIVGADDLERSTKLDLRVS